ncbi:MAG: trypsin-like serine protease [Beijerinckiaceae bacterium]
MHLQQISKAAWRLAALVCALVLVAAGDAAAIVGDSFDGAPWRRHVVMVLSRSGTRAGFCSGVVLAPTIILTAAHCVARAADARIYVRGDSGEPRFLTLARIAKHPGFRANAPRTRERSIDLALLETAESLPSQFAAPPLAGAANFEVGSKLRVAGFGVTREGEATSSGVLRIAELAVRPPLSSVLLWLDSQHRDSGACTGDSGGPVFTQEGQLAAIIAFAEGSGSHHCGTLTQAVLIAPHQAWIDGMIQRWR